MIEVSHLTKRYGEHVAVSDLCFTIDKGKITGFLGPNGAGKSTTMNILTGCLGASDGEVRIGGHDIFEEPMEAKRLIGYLPEQPPVYPDMTPREYLRFVGKAKGVPNRELSEQMDRSARRAGISEVMDRLIRNLSKGYRQRVGIAQALLGNPQVIILDEPTVGLDPAQIIEIRDLIRALGRDHTVILSSHILSEVSAVCDSVLIIAKGRLVASDTPENLEKLSAGDARLEIELLCDAPRARRALAAMPGAQNMQTEQEGDICRVLLPVDPSPDVRAMIFRACVTADTPIVGMQLHRASLEDVFLELTQDNEEVAGT